jgi:photoactive yellow protein
MSITEQLLQLSSMSPEDLDTLPFGAIVVDIHGTIKRYNAFEADLARLDASRVIGKNFFRDIAPCTAVQAFEGRLNDFFKSDERVSLSFDYRFQFHHGAVDVVICFVRLPLENNVLIAVDRRKPKSED